MRDRVERMDAAVARADADREPHDGDERPRDRLRATGAAARTSSRLLDQESIAYVALDLDPDRVRDAQAGGDSVVYGDATRRESLMAAGIQRAAALVVTYAETGAAEKTLHLAHELAPQLPVIVRTHDDADLDRLRAAGATEVVPEIVEGSLMLASHALVLLGVPVERVAERIAAARDSRYQMLSGFFHGADDRARRGQTTRAACGCGP